MKRKTALRPNTVCRVASLGADHGVSRRLAQMGILPGVEVTISRAGPLGGPLALCTESGQAIALRSAEAAAIELEVIALPLAGAEPGETVYTVRHLAGGESFRKKMAGMGITPGARLRIESASPFTVSVLPGGSRAVLGRGEADKVIVEPSGAAKGDA